MAGDSGGTRMKTVYVVIGWQTGEEDFISSIFEDEDRAREWCLQSELEDEYNYQYRLEKWELK